MPLKSSAPACVTALANLVTNSVRCKAAAKPAAKLGCVPGRRLEESSGPLPPSIRCRTGAPSPPPQLPHHSPWQFIYSSGGHSPGGLLTQQSGADGSRGSKFQARNNLMTCLGKDCSEKIPLRSWSAPCRPLRQSPDEAP